VGIWWDSRSIAFRIVFVAIVAVVGALVLSVTIAVVQSTHNSSPLASPSRPSPTLTRAAETATPTSRGSSASTSTSTPSPTATSPFVTGATGDALVFVTMLAQLPEDDSPESHGGYNRSLFNAWIDANGDGCNTRAEVLKVESASAISSHGTCIIDTGSWYSAYDGTWFTSARDLDIDHFVPLKEAWVSGAWQWTAATRTGFGNDLGYAASLLAVSSSSNRSKSDSDPARWLPRNADFYCDYAATWVAVKWRWSLSVDSLERDALNRLLSSCSSLSVIVPDKANVQVDPHASDGSAAQTGGGSGGGGSGDGVVDPNFGTCVNAKANGYGPYIRGVDPEYNFYRDADKDGRVCE